MDENVRSAGCVLRFFGADAEKIRRAAAALPGVGAQCADRGGETLLALRADEPRALAAAEKRLGRIFKNDLYGRGEQSLSTALAAQLEKRGKLLVCADAETGALLEPRLENIVGAAKFFDFGALSYANADAKAKIESRAARRADGKAPVERELARVRAALRVVGANCAVGSARFGGGWILFVGTRGHCWVRAVGESENRALWLMDMLRRAVCGLKQAEGTSRVHYSSRLRLPENQPKADTSPNGRKKHFWRKTLTLFAVLALICAAGAWYYTGGDLAAIPEALGFERRLHSGARFI